MNKQLFKFMLLCMSFVMIFSPVQTEAKEDKRIQTPCVSKLTAGIIKQFPNRF